MLRPEMGLFFQEKVKCHVWDGKSGLQDNSIRQLVLTSRHVRVYFEEKRVDKKPPYIEWLLQYVRLILTLTFSGNEFSFANCGNLISTYIGNLRQTTAVLTTAY